MKNILLKFSIFAICLILALSACSQWKGEWPDDSILIINDEDIIFKMPFSENTGWDKDGNEGWGRWMYVYDNTKNPFNLSGFDLSGMLADNKVYIFEYSFYSDVDIDTLGIYFFIDNPNWKMLSNWTEIKSNIKKNNIYEGKIIIIPNEGAAGCPPNNINLRFDINNRGVSDPAVLSFYKFTAGQIAREPAGIGEWVVSGKIFKITDVGRTFAEILTDDFEGYSNVLHIKPTYGVNNYGGSVIQYDLSEYAGKKIEITMSMFVYLKEEARIAWQINSTDPFYPVICGTVAPDWRLPYDSGPPLNANQWHYREGKKIITVPYTGNAGTILYLSGQQIEGKEAYFADAEITITEGLNEDVEFIGVTADGAPLQTTTWLTLNFNDVIPDLSVSDIILGGINGATGRMLSGEESEYKLLISGFTSSGDLTVKVRKAGFTIINPQKTVYIYYHPTFASFDGLKGLTTDTGDENEIIVDTERGVISREKNDDWDRWFSIEIPSSQLPIIASDKIIIKYIAVGEVQIVPKLPNSYIDVNPSMWGSKFIGDETVQTLEIDAVRYGASIPINVVTFQNSPSSKWWKLKIIDITKESGHSIPINLPLSDIRRPVTGKTPLKNIDNYQYSGTVSWSPNAATFTNGTPYTATISLTCKPGYTFDGITANSFKVIGASSVTHTAGAGNKMTITAAFPAASAPAPAKNMNFSAGSVTGYNVNISLTGNNGFTVTNNTNDHNWDDAYPYFKVKFDGSYTLSDYTKIEITVNPINIAWKPVRIAAYNVQPTGALNWYTANVIAAKEDGNPIEEEGVTKKITFDITSIPPDADLNEVYIAICIPAEPGARYTISNIRFFN